MTPDPLHFLREIQLLHVPTDPRGGGFTRRNCRECGFPFPCKTWLLTRGEAG